MTLMTPVEALCLRCIQSWLRIVRFKNGSCGEIDKAGRAWSRCSATEVQAWIAKEFECEVSARQCQNALRSLEESGRVIREKRWANRWAQAYSYSEPSIDQPQPIEPAMESKSVVPQAVDLSISSSLSSTKKSSVQSEVRGGRSDGSPPPTTSGYRSTGMSSKPAQIEGVSNARSLASIEELCRRIGSSELPTPSADPQRYIDELRKTNK